MATDAPANGASGSDRASIIAELASLASDDAPAEAAPSEEAPIEAPADGSTEEVEAAADESDEGIDAEPDAEPTDEDDPEETSDDPKVAKGLDQVRRAEKRSRERLDAEKQAFAAEREQYKAQLSELEQFNTLKARAKYDAPAVLRALGLNEDDFELAAHSIFAESKAGAADPQRKAVAQQRLREREKEDKISAMERRQAELEAKLEAKEKERVQQAEAARYGSEVNAVATTKYPLVAHFLKADGEGTTDALIATYQRLGKQLGRAPKPSEVVAAYDKSERARLQKLGIDPATIIKAAPKAPAKPAAPAPKAKPAANTNGTAKSDPSRDEIVAELARLS